jgi:branched-chain amino acid transport system substrate-binding protein
MRRPSEALRRRDLLTAAAACSIAPTAQAAPELIRLGQSVPISGPAQHLGIEVQRGLQLAVDAANATGALPGRRLELVSLDDQYEPELALENTRSLIQQDQVFALVGYVGTESTQRSLPVAIQAGVPMVAPLTGAESLRTRPSRWLYHLRPGLVSELGLIVRTLATMGWQHLAVVQQADADGQAGVEALRAVLTQAGLPPPLVVARIERNSTGQVALEQRDVQQVAQQLLSARPQAVLFLCAHAPTAAVLKRLRLGGYAGGAYATSLAGSAALGALVGPQVAGLNITQVVPSPGDVSRPVVAAYRQRLGNAAPEYVSLEAWIVGQLVIEALRRTPLRAGRQGLLNALESLGGWDPGGFALQWDPVRRQASSQVALTVLDAQGRPLR